MDQKIAMNPVEKASVRHYYDEEYHVAGTEASLLKLPLGAPD